MINHIQTYKENISCFQCGNISAGTVVNPLVNEGYIRMCDSCFTQVKRLDSQQPLNKGLV